MDVRRPLPALKPQAWAALFAAATLLALASTAQAAMALSYGGENVPWIGLLKARLVDWYGCALFIPLLYRLAAAIPIEARTWGRTLPLHLFAGLLCALGKEMLYVAIGNWFRPGVFHLPEILAGDYLDEVLFFWAAIALVHLYRRPAAGPAARERGHHADGFVAKFGGGYRMIASADIEWIDAQGNYARLHTLQGSFLIRETMAALTARLDSRFVRIHRSTIVDRTRIARIETGRHGRYRIVLTSGADMYAGRSYGQVVRDLLG